MYIEKINNPKDVKKLNIVELEEMACEIRTALIRRNSIYPAHLASNLGIVELSIALHYVFESPQDKIVFDVSHQSYVHKMLTGRKDAYLYSNNYADVSGFTNPKESEHDMFVMGHTSTSVSLAYGMAIARDRKGTDERIIAVIGDASLDGGQAFEGINMAGDKKTQLIIVVNDNNMSVPDNHGALHNHLNELHDNKGETANNFFESLGMDYVYVEDGNDLRKVIQTLNKIKDYKSPVVVHCRTKKGKGYLPAENDAENWHWAKPFDIDSGKIKNNVQRENYGDIVAEFLLDKMKKDSRLMVVTASTPICIGFNAERRVRAGDQFLDVGIAEQNALSISAGLAKNGCHPVVATNSTFIQRGYDQIEQEICLNKLPVTMIITHGSITGHNTDTHVGIYDIALLSNIPHLVYLAPKDLEEYLSMLEWSIQQDSNPVAIRVPWTNVYRRNAKVTCSFDTVRYEVVKKGRNVAILALGSFFELGNEVCKVLEEAYEIQASLINPRFITGIDSEVLNDIKQDHSVVITLEDAVVQGGFGAKISQFYSRDQIKVINKGFPLEIPNRFDSSEMIRTSRLQVLQIVEDIMEYLK